MRTGSGENIILIGMPTAGKSTVGVVLAKQLGYDYIEASSIGRRPWSISGRWARSSICRSI